MRGPTHIPLVLRVLWALALAPWVTGFYVPSIGPQYFHDGDSVPLLVNKVTSDETTLPYAYYDLSFVCHPADPEHMWLNLGEVLRGDRIMSSDYELAAAHNQTCKVLCTRSISPDQARQAKQLIQQGYHAEWIVDNLPGATTYRSTADPRIKTYKPGFALGTFNKFTDTAYLNNHVTLHVLYENVDPPSVANGRKLVVGFEVYPQSIANPKANECPDLTDPNPTHQAVGTPESSDLQVTYSYTVVWKEDAAVRWRNRWDRYLANEPTNIHWYSIINSVFVSVLLSGIVAIIMLRVLNRDLSMYNDEDREDQLETIGWKLLHGDVFRSPKFGGLLAPLLGSGVQIMLMAIATTLLAALGVLSPAYRGGMVSVAVLMYVLMGVPAGYWSARMFKVWRGTAWIKNALLTGFVVPGLFFVLYSGLNLFIWSNNSSSAIPFGTFFALGAIWFGLSNPLIVLGAFFGSKQEALQHPVRTNQIPRQIPPQPWYLRAPVNLFITGACPFGVIFVEMFFMLKSIWQDKFYYMYGFMALVGVILVITVIEITIVMIYFQLCSEDYRWWWQSFAYGGSSAGFIFAYSVFYFFTRLNVTHFIPALVFMVDSFLASLAYFFCFGSVAFFATYWFMRSIFSAVKLD